MKREASFVIFLALSLMVSCGNPQLDSKPAESEHLSQSESEPIDYQKAIDSKVLGFSDAAKAVEYDFDPRSIVPEEGRYSAREAYEATLSIADPDAKRERTDGSEIRLVMKFEGLGVDSFDGLINIKSANFSLWEDGLFFGRYDSMSFRGYWYYSSENDYERVIKLVDVSKAKETIYVAYRLDDFGSYYEYVGHDYVLDARWGGNYTNLKIFGSYYKPPVGIFAVKVNRSHMESFFLSIYENVNYCGYWLFHVNSDLRALKIVDQTKVNYEKELKYNQTHKEEIYSFTIEWHGFVTQFEEPV